MMQNNFDTMHLLSHFLACTCNGRSIYALRKHISGRVEEEQNKADFYLYYDIGGVGKWVVSESINEGQSINQSRSINQSINLGQPLLAKASAQPCPHTDDGVPWKYRSTKGRMENDDRSLDLGCGKE